MPTFSGSITTSGKSDAIRLEKALFRLHPEFRQNAKVRAQVIAPGHALVSVVEDGTPSPDHEDPVIAGFLAFLEKDLLANPNRIEGLSKKTFDRAARVTKTVTVAADELLPDDIAF